LQIRLEFFLERLASALSERRRRGIIVARRPQNEKAPSERHIRSWRTATMSLLTELEKFWRMIFYKYAAPTVLKGKLFAISPPIGLYYHFLPTCKRQTPAQIEKWPHGLIFARTDGKLPRTDSQIVRTNRKTRARRELMDFFHL
jgi:hypothetical protein